MGTEERSGMKIEANWGNYPEFNSWVDLMKAWVVEYGITQFIGADDDGLDPTGVIMATDRQLIWTAETAGDSQTITSVFNQGNSPVGGVTGWYIAKLPHSQELYLEDLKSMDCEECDTDGCEECDFEGTYWAYFEDTPAYPWRTLH
jgi:hypothetical protein